MYVVSVPTVVTVETAPPLVVIAPEETIAVAAISLNPVMFVVFAKVKEPSFAVVKDPSARVTVPLRVPTLPVMLP